MHTLCVCSQRRKKEIKVEIRRERTCSAPPWSSSPGQSIPIRAGLIGFFKFCPVLCHEKSPMGGKKILPKRNKRMKDEEKLDRGRCCFGGFAEFLTRQVCGKRVRGGHCVFCWECSAPGKVQKKKKGEGRGDKSDLFNFNSPCLTDLLCLLPGNCNA